MVSTQKKNGSGFSVVVFRECKIIVMDLEKAGQMAENYFGKIDGWKQWVLSTCWTNDFIETNIEISQTNETVFYFVARNIGITDYVIALFEIPESENDFHEVLKLLNVK